MRKGYAKSEKKNMRTEVKQKVEERERERDDRSCLTIPPPLTRSIGEKGGSAIGVLKKKCE